MIEKGDDLLKVCLVEDDPLVIKSLSNLLKEKSRLWTFLTTDDLFKQIREPGSASFDLIFLDLRHAGDPTGERSIEGISELIQRWPDAMIFVASGVDDLEAMRQCVARGADRFVSKEGLLSELPQILSTAQAWKDRKRALDRDLIGDSAMLRSLKRDLFRIQSLAADVLLLGETGSGKEVAARALHLSGPFVGLNVTTIPHELFESTLFGHEKGAFSGAQSTNSGMIDSASGGTLFLDEFQSLNLDHQAKLLRFLETREYFSVGSQRSKIFKGRVIFASNQNLQHLVDRGRFREDLYYRISQLSLKMPPLRTRRCDVPLLVEKFMSDESAAGKFRFSSEGIDFLVSEYDWPGNVRELRGLIRTLVSTSRIPIWGRSEIENGLGIEWKKSFESPMKNRDSSINSKSEADYKISWDLGLDANLDQLTQFMMDELAKKYESQEVQTLLKLKKSRFYQLLQQQKKTS